EGDGGQEGQTVAIVEGSSGGKRGDLLSVDAVGAALRRAAPPLSARRALRCLGRSGSAPRCPLSRSPIFADRILLLATSILPACAGVSRRFARSRRRPATRRSGPPPFSSSARSAA